MGMPDIPTNASQIAGLTPNTLYLVYFSDPSFQGDANGPINYQVTNDPNVILHGPGNMFVGSILTPAAGSGITTIGYNDGGSDSPTLKNGPAPLQVLSVVATQVSSAQQDRVFSLVTVGWTYDSADVNFDHVQVYFSNYKQQALPLLMAKSSGTSPNEIPDPDGLQLSWSTDSSLPYTSAGGAIEGGCWTYTGTGTASGFHFVNSQPFNVIPGQQYTLSAYIDGSHVTSGPPAISLYSPDLQTQHQAKSQTPGMNGRVSISFTVTEFTTVVALFDTFNCTVSNGNTLVFSDPQLEVGPAATNYQGAPTVKFLAEATGETVTVYVQSVSATGVVSALPQKCLSTTLQLTGVAGAPPSPTVAIPLAALGGGIGWTFTFNFENLANDVIAFYFIYKVASHSAPTPPASRYATVTAAPNQTGLQTYSDVTSGTWFYYISAVDTMGRESALSDASGTPVTIMRPSSSSSAGTPYTNPGNAFDGNNSTSATASISNSSSTITSTWSGWSAASGSPSTINLKVMAARGNPGITPAVTVIDYSTNSGSTWTTINSGSGATLTQTFAVALSPSQNLTTVQVRGTLNGAGTAGATGRSDIYEIWIEVS